MTGFEVGFLIGIIAGIVYGIVVGVALRVFNEERRLNDLADKADHYRLTGEWPEGERWSIR